MAYRQTVRTRANAQARRASIERAARHVIAAGGFASASIAAVAREAGCSAGSVYTYFTNREELLRLVFAQAAGHELTVIEDTVAVASTAADVADSTVEVFVRRAVAGRRLAHALLLEEVPEPVQRQRLLLRRGYVAAIAAALDRVRAAEAIPTPVDPPTTRAEVVLPPSGSAGSGGAPVPAEVAARGIVGAIAENLVDILDPQVPGPRSAEVDALVTTLSAFTRSALSAFTRSALGEP